MAQSTEHEKARARAYYKANRDKLLTYSKKWRAEHSEWCKQYAKEKRKGLSTEQKLELSKYHRDYYRKNIEKFKAYRKKYDNN